MDLDLDLGLGLDRRRGHPGLPRQPAVTLEEPGGTPAEQPDTEGGEDEGRGEGGTEEADRQGVLPRAGQG